MSSDLSQRDPADEMKTRIDVSCLHTNQIGGVICLLYHKALYQLSINTIYMES